VADVVDASGGQVVQDEHFIPARQARVGQMRPDETSAARDQNSHESMVPVCVIVRWHDYTRIAACRGAVIHDLLL
jgi:hypothetical protein